MNGSDNFWIAGIFATLLAMFVLGVYMGKERCKEEYRQKELEAKVEFLLRAQPLLKDYYGA